MKLHPIDSAIIILYFLFIFIISFMLKRRAGKNLDSYFLGGGSMPWWLLGMSGSSTYFDITGTMWMVSVFYMLGVKGMWEQWFWCFPFAGFLMVYKGKWNYRSGVLTSMEWLIFRYGSGKAGQAARLINVLVSVVLMILMLGYAGTGIGKFLEEFLPIGKNLAVPVLFTFTGIYVVIGGFFSVVYSDFIQTILLSFASVYISIVAFLKVDPEIFHRAVGNSWFSIKPVWELPHPPVQYSDIFGLLIILWLSKGVLQLFAAGAGATGMEFQRVRAARNEAEASKIALAWGVMMSVRWSLVIAFTVFGLSIFANNGVMVDSERILPMVLNRVLPVGIKGLVLAGLLAAFMSTFDSTLNVAASFIVNDLVKPVWKKTSSKQLMWVSYISTFSIVLLGIIISLNTKQIRDIWNPINFALGAALLAPALLAPYWWRVDGWTHCISGLITLFAAIWVYFFTDWHELQYFPFLAAIGFISTIAASYWLPDTSERALKNYYRKVRPFGFWRPVKRLLHKDGEQIERFKRDKYDLSIAVIATFFFIFLYLLMMDLVLHNWGRVIWLVILDAVIGVILYFTWWKKLSGKSEAE
ncbi:MAG TPA: hypothetical protein ENH29_11250 [Bacteroidetes bacterium]|nr:hypothetical protein [Bacteroidota bacterium]